LLRLHAACAKTQDLSAAGEHVDDIIQDAEETAVRAFASDGATPVDELRDSSGLAALLEGF
jgi:hypothetical protein